MSGHKAPAVLVKKSIASACSQFQKEVDFLPHWKKTSRFSCAFLMVVSAYQTASVIFMSLHTAKALKGKNGTLLNSACFLAGPKESG